MMNEILLLKGNPSKRRGKKRRSAAQRAATRKLVALNKGKSPTKRRAKRRTKSVAPVARRRSYARRSVRRSARRSYSRGMGSGIVAMMKTGAIMGGGALVADVGMGLVQKALPTMTSITSRVNPDGSVNFTYYAAKGALIYAMGKYGARVTRHAPVMAAGAITVMAYELFKSFMPSDGSIPLGYFNPGRVVNGGNLGRIMRTPGVVPQSQFRGKGVSGLSKIITLPSGTGKGAIAAATIRNLSGARR